MREYYIALGAGFLTYIVGHIVLYLFTIIVALLVNFFRLAFSGKSPKLSQPAGFLEITLVYILAVFTSLAAGGAVLINSDLFKFFPLLISIHILSCISLLLRSTMSVAGQVRALTIKDKMANVVGIVIASVSAYILLSGL
jgi:hypothetical protein